MDRYFVYILKSKIHDKTYVGFTNNLPRRLKEHNSGKSEFTKKFIPWEIVFSEECQSLETAVKLEKYYKSAAGRRKIKTLLNAPVAQQDRATVS